MPGVSGPRKFIVGNIGRKYPERYVIYIRSDLLFPYLTTFFLSVKKERRHLPSDRCRLAYYLIFSLSPSGASPSGRSQCFTHLLPSCVRIHRFCSQSLPPRRLFQTQGASCCFVRSGGLRHHNRCSHAVVIAGCLRHGSPGKCIHAMFLSLVYFSALPILIQVQLHASV